VYALFYEAVRDFFAQAQHAGQAVPCVFATPDRAHAEMTRVSKRRLQGAKALAEEDDYDAPVATAQAIEDRPAPSPFMSVHLSVPEYDPTRFNPGRFVVTKDFQAGTATVMRFPRPVVADVQVDLWVAGRGANKIAMALAPQIDLRFYAESVWLPVDWTLDKWYRPPFDFLEHGRVLGRTRVRLMAARGWVDNSDLEPGDNPKAVRWTWSGKLEGYIPYRPVEARLVRSVRYELYDSTSTPPQLLLEDVGGSED
jgi:hypothetical protein